MIPILPQRPKPTHRRISNSVILVKLVKNSSFVYISLLCVAFYSAVFPFIQYAPDLLVNKFGFSYILPEGASVVMFGSEATGNAFVYIVVFFFALGITLIPNYIKGVAQKNIARVIILGLFAVIVAMKSEMIGLWLGKRSKNLSPDPNGNHHLHSHIWKYRRQTRKSSITHDAWCFLAHICPSLHGPLQQSDLCLHGAA